jgi:hypothetical protein
MAVDVCVVGLVGLLLRPFEGFFLAQGQLMDLFAGVYEPLYVRL